MSTQELGKALAEARKARGLTLLDVERDTRISSKYLQALEEGHLDMLPAPVYARAFMRTYAQYLGLNATSFVQRMPGARPEPELPPLPDVRREVATPLISPNWLIAGAVVVVLLFLGLLLFWNRGGDGEETVTSNPPAVTQPTGQGAEEQPSTPGPIEVEPGVVPDLEDEHVLVALTALQDAGLRYLIVEVENGDVAQEIVFDQSPTAGTEAEDDTVVTLLVAR
jgi:cytoskeletal protein RodZ